MNEVDTGVDTVDDNDIDQDGFTLTRDTSVRGIADFIIRAIGCGRPPFDGRVISTEVLLRELVVRHGISISKRVANAALKASGCHGYGERVIISGRGVHLWGVGPGHSDMGRGQAINDYMFSWMGVDGGGAVEVVAEALRGVWSSRDLVSVADAQEHLMAVGCGASAIAASKALAAAGGRRLGQVMDVGRGRKVVVFAMRNKDRYEARPFGWIAGEYNKERG